MLEGVKVLELSSPLTMLAGRMLADLGAEVLVVEPLGGAAGRRLRPFLDRLPGLERSLSWHAYNIGKQAITANLEVPDGREILRELASQSDILLEALPPSGVSRLADHDDLQGLVRCEISSFSRTGPKRDFVATDPVVMAAAGPPAMTGEGDRAPIFFPFPQAMMEAGAEAAVAALSGLAGRGKTGAGQRVRLNARTAAMVASFGRPIAVRNGASEGSRPQTVGNGTRGAPAIPMMFDCADGFVLLNVVLIPAFSAMTQRTVQWLGDAGHLAPDLAALDWIAVAQEVTRGERDETAIDALVEALVTACRGRTKIEITDIAQKHRFMAAPVMDMTDVRTSEHYQARGLFTETTVLDRPVPFPSRFAQFENYEIEARSPAPKLSEHTAQVLHNRLGYSAEEIQALYASGVI